MTLGRITMTCRGLVAAAVIITGASCSSSTLDQSGSSSSSPDAAASPTAEATVPTPRTTPPGTPAPTPAEPNANAASVEIPSSLPAATPSATPQPGLWRVEGYVLDEDGAPLPGVCVVVGPRGCQPFSPHTDERGHWSLDIAEGSTIFDFYFEMPGHKTIWWHVQPTGPTEFNVVLAKG